MLNDKEEKNDLVQSPELEELIKSGLHFGHKTNKKHPKMEPYIFGVRNGVSVIDVSKTKECLDKAMAFLAEAVSQEKTVLLVGTKVQLKNLVKTVAQESEIPYINERWLGGTITNFEVIKKRVDYLKDLEKKRDEGDLEKYTKKEKLDIMREIDSLKVKFEGLKSLTKIPDIIFVLDMVHDDLAVKEARAKKVKIIAIADTNANPDLADYPIPANDDALPSVKYILARFQKVISESKEKKNV
jgi:small subunit ribosomal protein S2